MCVHIAKMAIGKGEWNSRAKARSILEIKFYLRSFLWCLRLGQRKMNREPVVCKIPGSKHFSGTFWGLGLGTLLGSACVSVHNEQLSWGTWPCLIFGDRSGGGGIVGHKPKPLITPLLLNSLPLRVNWLEFPEGFWPSALQLGNRKPNQQKHI